MHQPEYAVVLITVPSGEEAQKIKSALLDQRKAACVNIIAGVSSYFWWRGKIDHADELLLIIKTRLSLVPEIVDAVKRHHSYTVPEIIALPVVAGNDDYLRWIGDETGK